MFQGGDSGARGLARQLADRSGSVERLTTSSIPHIPGSWSPDGRVLALTLQPPSDWDIFLFSLEGDSEPQPFIQTPNLECCPMFSPDGQWIAYVSEETGQMHVYVRPYPGPDIKFLVSEEEGGGQPVWSPDGSELFYRIGDKMMVVSIRTKPTFNASRPQVLFEGSYLDSTFLLGNQYYDISPDGQQFLMIKSPEGQAQINVVLNWFEELKHLVPTN
jgi:Tol biopolymer transport system component